MLFLGLSGCAVLEDYIQIQQPSARIAGAHLQNITLDSLTLLFDVEVENPYSVALPLVNLDYSLCSRDQQFLSGASELSGSVPAGRTKVVQLPAKVAFVNLVNTIAGIRPGSVLPYTAEFGLSVDAPVLGRVRVPLASEGELPVPTVPGVGVSEVRWETLNLNEATGRVKLDLVNKNEFPFELSRLTYGFSLGGVQVAKSSMVKAVSFDAAGGAGTIEIPISFSPVSLGFGLFQMLTSDQAGYEFRGDLKVNTPFGPMTFPLDTTGRAALRR
jgi:LEA14-like dessication related protein